MSTSSEQKAPQAPQAPLSVLFVCLGNICRSPMAEAAFRDTVKKTGYSNKFDIIDSCGTAAYHIGEEPDSRTIDTLRKHSITTNHLARQVHSSDFKEFDYILAMDRSNWRNLLSIRPKDSKAKVMLFGDFAPENKKGEAVEDPYYGGMGGFEQNFKQVVSFSREFLRQVLGAKIED